MATLNGLYIHVTEETVSRDLTVPIHPVENGIGVTDAVRLDPVVYNLKGKLVDYRLKDSSKEVQAQEVLSKIKSLADSGAFVRYSGRNVLLGDEKTYGYVIRCFNTTHVNTINGGADFEMELQEIRIAKSSYNTGKTGEVTNAGTQQVTQGNKTAVYHVVKRGDTLWNLVNVVYKGLNTSVDWVIANNKSAFNGTNDPAYLQTDARLLMGYR